MKQSASLTDRPPARRRAFRLFGLALTVLTLALALPAGAATFASPAAASAPTITSFTPDEGPPGTLVTLTGSGFSGATRVDLGRWRADFTVVSDAQIRLTVPAYFARSGFIDVKTPGGTAWSAETFTVSGTTPIIRVTAPTGTGSYAQGSSLTVRWEIRKWDYYGVFGVGVRSPAGDWNIGLRVSAGYYGSYTVPLTVDVPVGSGYQVMVAWRPEPEIGSWGAFATSPGSFAVTARSAAKAITAFSFQGLTPPVIGVINGAARTIAVTVPRATDVHALVATFTTTGAAVAVGGTPQVSGTTANDFSSPVTYKVTADDGSTQDYTVTVTVPVAPVAIGEACDGGVVAYILQSGDPGYSATVQHGLIAATGDQGDAIRWALPSYEDTSVPGGTGTAIGTGAANTTKIIAQNGAGVAYAAGLARAYMGGGYRDWYLPSRDELNKLYTNRVAVGGFVSYCYWSSSEFGGSGACYQWFSSGRQSSNLKGWTYAVRAVRSF